MEHVQLPAIVPGHPPRPRARLSLDQKSRDLSSQPGKIHTAETPRRVYQLVKNPLGGQVSPQAIDWNDPGRKPRPDVSKISSEQIDRLWFRRKIEICPVIDIFV